MGEIRIFDSSEFGQVRSVEINGEAWFVGKDVAKALGYGNHRQALKTNVDEEDKGVHSVDTLSGRQNMTIINESGIYSLIIQSKLPSAKRFKRWVTAEVLPAIRRDGGYGSINAICETVTRAVLERVLPMVGEMMAGTVSPGLLAPPPAALSERQARRRARSKIDLLPSEVRAWVLWELCEGKRTFDDISDELFEMGYEVSRGALFRYRQRVSSAIEQNGVMDIRLSDGGMVSVTRDRVLLCIR